MRQSKTSQMGVEIDKLVDLGCQACEELDKVKHDFSKTPDLDKWWKARKTSYAGQQLRKKAAEKASNKKVKNLKQAEKTLLKEQGYL